ncbi:MAG: hypothetical protein ACREHG_01350 [Candidatus Saccharimonadales bacterium]
MLLTRAEFDATYIKIEKLNARAAKKGWTGELLLDGWETEVTETGPSGLKVTKIMVEAEITGKAPCYGGWTFLARIEWTQNGDSVTFNAPGVDNVTRPTDQKCDHCGINRFRKYTYIVTDGTDEIQVGSTCLKDFLGWNANPVFLYPPSKDDLFGEAGYGHGSPDFATESVLAASWAAIQTFGWVPASDYSGNATKYVVQSILDPINAKEREFAMKIAPVVSEAESMAKRIREFVLSDEFSGSSDYVLNLKNIARAEYVESKFFGFLVSAPQAWAKAQERTLIKARENAEIRNEWNGQPKDKVELNVTLKSIRFIEGQFGTTDLYTFHADDNSVYKWFSSRTIFTEKDIDVSVKVKGTIKNHDEYKGMKSTILTRVKRV